MLSELHKRRDDGWHRVVLSRCWCQSLFRHVVRLLALAYATGRGIPCSAGASHGRRWPPRGLSVIAVLVVLLAHGSITVGDTQFPWPGSQWQETAAGDVGLDDELLKQARDYALTAGGSGMIVRHGQVVLRWGDQDQRYDIKSASKSIGATALGLAVKDGKLALDDQATKRHPTFGVPPDSNARGDWLGLVTLRHLATQTAGFAKPGGYEKLLFRPGTKWHYSDGGPNWLAECITLAYQSDVEDLMFERVFTPIGIDRDDLRWRKNQYRPHMIDGLPRREFGAGVHANVDALARIGYLYLRGGKWRDQQILTSDFVTVATSPFEGGAGLPERDEQHGNASEHYGLLWWNNADGTLDAVPSDAFWAWGLYDSLIVVIPSLDLVVARGGARGKSWPRKQGANHYDVLEPFLNPIVEACRSKVSQAPYPPSQVIASITWAPRDTIVRRAHGGDNWPVTWGDDDYLYTAYGDGHGFEPKVDRKLSLGLARVKGDPAGFVGENVRSKVELVGDGAKGRKASGLVMIDGELLMFVRNAKNSQLAWSEDRGKTWTWADWRFETSFGCPTILNFGKNYAGARDEYVYVYSFDSDSAYEPADRMVLARVPKSGIKQRDAYEFFVGLDSVSKPIWSKQIARRGAVFRHARRCYRSGISYVAALKRYLWVQLIPDLEGEKADTRFAGGFGVYDAANPWGPWTTVYFTERWDVGPGESASFPTKWMSQNGHTLYLVFSGDDAFSVRRATLKSFGDDSRG